MRLLRRARRPGRPGPAVGASGRHRIPRPPPVRFMEPRGAQRASLLGRPAMRALPPGGGPYTPRGWRAASCCLPRTLAPAHVPASCSLASLHPHPTSLPPPAGPRVGERHPAARPGGRAARAPAQVRPLRAARRLYRLPRRKVQVHLPRALRPAGGRHLLRQPLPRLPRARAPLHQARRPPAVSAPAQAQALPCLRVLPRPMQRALFPLPPGELTRCARHRAGRSLEALPHPRQRSPPPRWAPPLWARTFPRRHQCAAAVAAAAAATAGSPPPSAVGGRGPSGGRSAPRW